MCLGAAGQIVRFEDADHQTATVELAGVHQVVNTGMLTGGSDPPGPGDWVLRPPGNQSGQAWRVEPYIDEHTATLVSPQIDHPGGTVKLTWSMAHNTEAGFDYVTVEWSGADGSGGTLFGASGQNAAWPEFDVFERSFVAPPGPLTIRVKMSSDQLVSGIGAALDDVKVER